MSKEIRIPYGELDRIAAEYYLDCLFVRCSMKKTCPKPVFTSDILNAEYVIRYPESCPREEK